MIYYAIEACKSCNALDEIYVSTDDPEIAMLSVRFGAKVVDRPGDLANDAATLDPVVHHAVEQIEKDLGVRFDVVVTVQATSPLVLPADIEAAVWKFRNPDIDTVLSVVDDRHLCWGVMDGRAFPLYKARVNRQSLPSNFRETGAVIACTRQQLESGTRVGSRVELLEIPYLRSFDIDSVADLLLCEGMLLRRRVVFVVVGYPEVGLGHAYRALMLAHELVSWDIHFVCQESSRLAAELIASHHYRLHVCTDEQLLDAVCALKPDVVVNDILDTSSEYVDALKRSGARVVNFEDMGTGSDSADLVVNALYALHSDNPNVLVGPRYFCLRDEFLYLPERSLRERVSRVLVTFGGVDESDITSRVVAKISVYCARNDIAVDVIVGPGYRHGNRLRDVVERADGFVNYIETTNRISDFMADADMAITSGGRTVLELAALQVPTIVICQNQRELTHEFAREENGVVNLGLCADLDFDRFLNEFELLVRSDKKRSEMRERAARLDLRQGKKRVIDAIVSTAMGEGVKWGA